MVCSNVWTESVAHYPLSNCHLYWAVIMYEYACHFHLSTKPGRTDWVREVIKKRGKNKKTIKTKLKINMACFQQSWWFLDFFQAHRSHTQKLSYRLEVSTLNGENGQSTKGYGQNKENQSTVNLINKIPFRNLHFWKRPGASTTQDDLNLQTSDNDL